MVTRKFDAVMGKGGVGRTTVSAALALASARRGEKTLIAMCNANETLSHLLGVQPIGDQITPIAKNLDAVNMTPQSALQEYGRMIVKPEALYRITFENKKTLGFLLAIPGMEAWSMLGKACFHVESYDRVILDMPSSGVALDMLRVPKALSILAPGTLLSRAAQAALELFRDPTRSRFVLVSLAEMTPAQEAIETSVALSNELQIPTSYFIVNQVMAEHLGPFAADLKEHTLSAEVLQMMRQRLSAEKEQVTQIQRLIRTGKPTMLLPKIWDRLNREDLENEILPIVNGMA